MLKGLKLLVVAAWEPELVRFRERFAAGGAPAGLELSLATVGVGVVEAAVGMTQCIARHEPDLALLLGTAGVLPRSGAPPLGGVVAASRVRLVDAGTLDGTAELPGPMPAAAVLDVGVHDALVRAGARSVQIANTVGITVDDALASRIAGAGTDDVEHLEAFGFARACASVAVPCGIVLGIANVVGARGRAEWLANHTSASASAADVAYEALAALVPLVRTSTRARSPERA
jgi:nucleoside phosphorylase